MFTKSSPQDIFDFSFNNLVLVLSIRWQKSLDSLKKSASNGSFIWTRVGRFKLVGSKTNWHSNFSSSTILSKLIVLLDLLQSILRSDINFSLSTAIPRHALMIWLYVSSQLGIGQILQCGEPPDCLAFML